MIWSLAALLLGLIVVVVLAALCSPLADQPDPAMVWEARVAVGFAAIGFAGPFWVAQGVVTLVASFDGDGLHPGWLWAWFVVAPPVGASPPAAALVRLLHRVTSRRSSPTYSVRGAAAVQHEANVAWAATTAEPGWELRRTPPLPASWPPSAGQPVVWLCYAERPRTPQAVEIAAPWARISLEPGESPWPTAERLSDAAEPLGIQAVHPLESGTAATSYKSQPLLDALYRGDPDGRVERALASWRSLNGVIASHPAVIPHLPPG